MRDLHLAIGAACVATLAVVGSSLLCALALVVAGSRDSDELLFLTTCWALFTPPVTFLVVMCLTGLFWTRTPARRAGVPALAAFLASAPVVFFPYRQGSPVEFLVIVVAVVATAMFSSRAGEALDRRSPCTR